MPIRTPPASPGPCKESPRGKVTRDGASAHSQDVIVRYSCCSRLSPEGFRKLKEVSSELTFLCEKKPGSAGDPGLIWEERSKANCYSDGFSDVSLGWYDQLPGWIYDGPGSTGYIYILDFAWQTFLSLAQTFRDRRVQTEIRRGEKAANGFLLFDCSPFGAINRALYRPAPLSSRVRSH